MKLTNLTIKDLITPEAKLTFLVGAGCSIDAPSCLPSGRQMMDAIIEYTCAESEIKKIKDLKELRFESLVESIRQYIDPMLRFIDYYGLCVTPNLNHFFFAEMIKKGHFVMTANLDFLIEYALKQSGVSNDEIIPVITREDFEKYTNPYELFKHGKKAVYKIYGATKNVITGEDTRNSLIASVQGIAYLGDGKISPLEPFKRPLLEKITKNRSLVIMGYSVSDDLGIIPILKVLKIVQDVIWIYYVHNDKGKEIIYEIELNTDLSTDYSDKLTQILSDIKRVTNVDHVYRVDVNITRMINELSKARVLNRESFLINPLSWFKNNIKEQNELTKYLVAFQLYFDNYFYDDALRCAENILHIIDKYEDKFNKAYVLNTIGSIYQSQGNYPEALRRYKKALQINEQLGDLNRIATVLNNIGEIYKAQGNYPEAIRRYEEALQIVEQLGDLSGKATVLNNIGSLLYNRGDLAGASKQYEEALQIDEQLGDLSRIATVYNNIGEIYRAQGNYRKALKYYREALKIAEQLGDLSGKATILNNIGLLLYNRGDLDGASKRYEEALQIDQQLGDLSRIATVLNNIGVIYKTQGNYPKALKYYMEALKIAEQLGDLSGKAIRLNNIGEIYRAQGNYPEALRRYKEALQIDREIGNLSGSATRLSNMGIIYQTLGYYSKALNLYNKALQIYKGLRNLSGTSIVLANMGCIYQDQGKHLHALKLFEKALKINEQLGDLSGKAILLNQFGGIYYEQEKYYEALKYYKESLMIFKQIDMEESPNVIIIKKNLEFIKQKIGEEGRK